MDYLTIRGNFDKYIEESGDLSTFFYKYIPKFVEKIKLEAKERIVLLLTDYCCN